MNRKNNNGMLKNTLYYILVLLAMAGRYQKVEETQGLNSRCNKWGPAGQ